MNINFAYCVLFRDTCKSPVNSPTAEVKMHEIARYFPINFESNIATGRMQLTCASKQLQQCHATLIGAQVIHRQIQRKSSNLQHRHVHFACRKRACAHALYSATSFAFFHWAVIFLPYELICRSPPVHDFFQREASSVLIN